MVDGDYGTPTAEYYTAQNSFNQTFITTVRNTGGRNAHRNLVVQGFNTNIGYDGQLPATAHRSEGKRMMVEVHYYDPYNFTLNGEQHHHTMGQGCHRSYEDRNLGQ